MIGQTNLLRFLGGSPSGVRVSRLCTLALTAVLNIGLAVACFAQPATDAAKPAKAIKEQKTAAAPAEKIANGYIVHQSIEVGGRYTTTGGSAAMWASGLSGECARL